MDDTQSTVNKAREEFNAGKKPEAFTALAVQWAMLLKDAVNRPYSALVPEPGDVPHAPANVKIPHQYESYVNSLHKTTKHLVQNVNALVVGIDPVKWEFFRKNTPHVNFAMAGNPLVTAWGKYDHSEAVFEACAEILLSLDENLKKLYQPPA